jgi:DNA-binding protein YbaB
MLKIPEDILNQIKNEAEKTSQLLKERLVTIDRQNGKVMVTFQGQSIFIKQPTATIKSGKVR